MDPIRPVTMTRLRWDAVLNYTLPDRNEFFMPRLGTVTGGRGIRPTDSTGRVITGPGGAPIFLSGLRYNDLAIYAETAATPALSLFTEFPYRSLDPAEPYPLVTLGQPRGRINAPGRVTLPDGWLADPDADAVPDGAELPDSGG